MQQRGGISSSVTSHYIKGGKIKMTIFSFMYFVNDLYSIFVMSFDPSCLNPIV